MVMGKMVMMEMGQMTRMVDGGIREVHGPGCGAFLALEAVPTGGDGGGGRGMGLRERGEPDGDGAVVGGLEEMMAPQ